MDKAFHQGMKIIEELEKSGHEAYFVGGSVRDTLMNRAIGDIDIATSATPQDIQRIFPKTIDVGAEHGTIIVLTAENESFEVTTYRTESQYSDNRRPDQVTFVKSLFEDLKRRDFTMNAIAMTKTGTIVDPFQGEKDIKRKIIRSVGIPRERFQEDALRMLRAIRFASQLSFSLESNTFLAIMNDHERLHSISVERKTAEIEKLLAGIGLKYCLELLVKTKLYKHLPELSDKKSKLLELSTKNLCNLNSRSALWAAFVHVLEIEQIDDFLTSWKLPKKVIKAVEHNIAIITNVQKYGWNKELIYQMGLKQSIEAHEVLVALNPDTETSNLHIENLYKSLPIKNKKEIVFNGHDLIKIAGEKRGKWIAELYQDMELAIIHGSTANDRAVLKEWVEKWLQKYEKSY
ncbi:CCA tRNA nucleotidyltransferase [Sutcliffiella rhizosphaerae]|uniref:CCA-adding enzyme n=1 Tax=Sutcliffiella rhizosphaerae TaxID=2880967 RepID=A0ABN8AHR9_9BACI|nr:CCA tRNA nucleotidyltransferase [Sutcliffiella rhizosphaerae]CAG9622628.1 CCA-adding enzyme [Sutcliffiella rhizosphaerae]